MLRPYQASAVEALYAFLAEKDTNPCVVIPTGGGKTHVIAKVCQDATSCWGGGGRVLVLAHRKELLEQSVEKISRYAQGVDIGVYSAGLGRRERKGQIIVAGIQSVFRRADRMGKFDLILVDEAHLIPTDGEGMYRKFLKTAKELNPIVRMIGLTATPYRMTTGWICSEANLLNEICYEVGVKTLIDCGHLCNLVSKSGLKASLPDLSEVHLRGGEYIPGEVETAFTDDHEKVRSAVSEVLEYAKDRKKVLIFACGIKHAGMIEEAIVDTGVDRTTVGSVFGDTPEILRAGAISEFKNGSLKYLINVNVLTEGFDAPNIDLIALMRATKSPGLYYQMVGRGLRLCEGKENCLVLDFGGNVERHGTVDRVIPGEVTSSGAAKMKTCPKCQNMLPPGTMKCDCGYVYPNLEVLREEELARHAEKASDAEILSSVKTEWQEVTSASYAEHEKAGADSNHPRTLRVTYYTMVGKFSEWVCVEHARGSYANQKALAWWGLRSKAICPNTAKEAARLGQEGFLRIPSRILVRTKGRELPKIEAAEFLSEIPEPPAEREPGGEEDLELVEVATEKEESLLEAFGHSDDECPF